MVQKIFIVEGDVMRVTMQNDHLRNTCPHAVTAFHAGEDCLARFTEHPDLMIFDCHLNNMENDAADGLRILEMIKSWTNRCM